MIKQASWCRYDYVGAGFERVDFILDFVASIENGCLESRRYCAYNAGDL